MLRRLCGFGGGVAAALVAHDAVAKTGNFYFSWGDDPVYTKTYFGAYVQINPIVPIIPTCRSAKSTCSRPILLVLENALTSMIAINIARHERQGMADPNARHCFSLLAPHLRRAAVIGKLIEVQKVETRSLAATLDQLTAGVVIVTNDGRILHANEAARRMFAAGEPIRSIAGRLFTADTRSGDELARSVAFSGVEDAAIGAAGIGVALRTGAAPAAVAHVLPLAHGASRRRLLPNAAAAVFVTTTAVPQQPRDLAALAAGFGLAPAVHQLLAQLVAGATIAEACAALEPSSTTRLSAPCHPRRHG
jgi:PAS domain-containing protein